eukprot:CAMPEP_0113681996 /NCGR_PEP_ID=MMETSP0038_2-20120614/12360_1 /TAXON_ID=2898 /ORGANISM="Cryptomonas paramecium" /LENGTH=187 /DNA_ID=CAMNT_0000600901 /DNA_START=26 /DNA_END=585 /DNA_ORIENTATION=+ /assembly_acc=CAM_ASM_000170
MRGNGSALWALALATVLTLLVTTTFLRADGRGELLNVVSDDDSKLADLYDAPMMYAKDKISNMLDLDMPGQYHPRLNRDIPQIAKCTGLACQEGFWENDYLSEADRRMTADAHQGQSAPKVDLKTLVKTLKEKFKEMKKQFLEVRARFTSGPAKELTVTVRPRGPRGADGPPGPIGVVGDRGPLGPL